MIDARIPVTLLTGFLGSGKTTLLNRLMGTPQFERAAVVINEFGEMAIDHLLVASPMEHLVVLDNGCICCTARGDLAGALRRLRGGHEHGVLAFDRVVVETTGLADPVPLMETLCEDAEMASLYRPHGVITMVDAVNAAGQLHDFAEPVKQVAIADRLLVSKPDLASPSALDRLETRLRSINPGAPIVRVVTTRASVSAALGPIWQPEAEGAFDWLARADRAARARGAGRAHLARSEDLDTFTLVRDGPVTRAGLILWLDQMAGLEGPRLLRMKGVLNVEGEPVAVHAVQKIVHEPVFLPRWPDEERRSRLVFITRGLERAAVEKTLETLGFELGAKRGRFVDAGAYARFVAAARRFRR
jgi:G3E family GTPase